MPGALIGRARALDNLAEKSRNNALLRQAIDAYLYAIDQVNDELTDEEFQMMAERCIDRQRFLGEVILLVVIDGRVGSLKIVKSGSTFILKSYLLRGVQHY